MLVTSLVRSDQTERRKAADARCEGAGARPLPPLFTGYVGQTSAPTTNGLKRHELVAKPAKRSRPDDFLSGVLHHFEDSADRLGLNPELRERILKPKRVITAPFEIEMDDGSQRAFTFRRIQQSTALGPGKGGIRWAPGAGEDMIRALAFEMPMKPAIYGLPLGGAKGGIDVDPKSLSTGESARLMRGSIRAAMDQVWERERALAFGPRTDIPAPDVGTSHPEINLMDLAVDEYLGWVVAHELDEVDGFEVPPGLGDVARGAETDTPYLDRYLALFEAGAIPNLGLIATFTGKSEAKGGSLGRTAATGLGVAYATLELLKRDGLVDANADRFSGQTVAVQGFGNVGLGALRAYTELGAKVVALREFDGKPYALYREGGFDAESIAAMVAFKKKHGTLRGFPGAEVLRPEAFWKLPVDVLAPCARENEITPQIARTIGARCIAEGANGPTMADADEILERRRIQVLPDIFANAAGVIVSWFEMVQNMSGERWTLERVKRELNAQMAHAFAEISAANTNLRDAAFDRAVLDISSALHA